MRQRFVSLLGIVTVADAPVERIFPCCTLFTPLGAFSATNQSLATSNVCAHSSFTIALLQKIDIRRMTKYDQLIVRAPTALSFPTEFSVGEFLPAYPIARWYRRQRFSAFSWAIVVAVGSGQRQRRKNGPKPLICADGLHWSYKGSVGTMVRLAPNDYLPVLRVVVTPQPRNLP